MDITQEKDKIREIIRRSSIRNYFTPLLPKHSEKPKLSKYSKFLLKYQEPKKQSPNPPVSIKNYKIVPILTHIDEDPNFHLPRRLSQVSSKQLHRPSDIPTPIYQLLLPLRKSSEIPLSITHDDTPDKSRKNHSSLELENFREYKEPLARHSKQQTILNKEHKFISISQIKHLNHPKTQRKDNSRVREIITLPKYVSTGENTDETDLNGWDYSPDLSNY